MSEVSDSTYWMAVAHLPRWTARRRNKMIIAVLHERKISWEDFFEMEKDGWMQVFDFNERELQDLSGAKEELPGLSFISEQLHNEGFNIIPVNSNKYPKVLKENLGTDCPSIIYVKGLSGMLQEDAVAIVGSRKAGKKALEFTENMAQKAVKDYKIVVSGFAKGVDRKALDATLENNGRSIIVLPQGILTFKSGFNKYYEQIVNGEILVLSTFPPNAGWDVGLAMARNKYIYGLAKEIFVAQTDEKGGTWQGAMAGLKKNRKVFVRHPSPAEKNGNLKLIELGGISVDMLGEKSNITSGIIDFRSLQFQEEKSEYASDPDKLEEVIFKLLKSRSFTAKEVIMALSLNDWKTQKMTAYLSKNQNFVVAGEKPKKFTAVDKKTPSLFD